MPHAPRCFALVPCAGVGLRAGAGGPKQYATCGPQRGGAHAAGPGCRAANWRPRWWCCRPKTRSSRLLPPPSPAARLGGPLWRRHARRLGGGWPGGVRARGAGRRGLGAGARRRALPAAARVGAAPDRRLPRRCRGRPAGAAAGRHAQAGRARRPCASHTAAHRQVGWRRRRRCSAWACCSGRWRRPATAVTDEASAIESLGLAPRLVPGEIENLKLTWPADFALAARLLETR
jgi:2-C-methyl-D-erythritol 4-phosphate cytidylyltransferase